MSPPATTSSQSVPRPAIRAYASIASGTFLRACSAPTQSMYGRLMPKRIAHPIGRVGERAELVGHAVRDRHDLAGVESVDVDDVGRA